MMQYRFRCASPLGGITLASDGTALTGLWFDGQRHHGDFSGTAVTEQALPVFAQTVRWLGIYFSGTDPGFTPPVRLLTTPFRRAVCEILQTVPYGQTVTYGEIAAILAAQRGISRMSAQAVGGAVGHNPVSLIIPCHRVIGADGSLTGYAGGIERKRKLLELEGSAADEKVLCLNKRSILENERLR